MAKPPSSWAAALSFICETDEQCVITIAAATR